MAKETTSDGMMTKAKFISVLKARGLQIASETGVPEVLCSSENMEETIEKIRGIADEIGYMASFGVKVSDNSIRNRPVTIREEIADGNDDDEADEGEIDNE